MKLTKCYVFSFGKLQNVTFDLESGLNTFKEDNGWGKSTLATFIKAIFYGLNDSKKSVAENERLKYKTWNTTQKFGGYIEFEWGDKQFKLERYFGNKQSEDTVSLTDIATGKNYNNTDNLGARIFQIDEEGFLSTTYFSQKDFQVKSNTSITAKFNSVCEIQDSDAFDKAILKLEEKAKTYKKTGDKGLIADTKREIFAIGEEIQKANLAEKTVESLKQSVLALEKQTNELKEETGKLTKQVAEAGKAETISLKKEQYKTTVAKKERYLAQQAENEKILNGNRPSQQELSAFLECSNELNKVSALESVLAEDINEINNQLISNKTQGKKALGLPQILAIIGSLAFLIAMVLLIVNNLEFSLPSIVLFSITAVLEISSLIFYLTLKQKNNQNQSNNQLLEQKLKDYNEYKSIKENYEQNLERFLSKFSVDKSDYLTAISTISSVVKSANIIDKEIEELNKIIVELEKDKEIFNSSNKLENISILKNQLVFVQDEYTKKANELARKKADVKYYQDQADTLTELEGLKAELLSKQEQLKEEYGIILKTLEFLNKADENLKVKYRLPLENSLNKYLSLISKSNKVAKIDVDLNITIEENGGAKQPEYYSKGEQNLFEICKRFALADVLFTGEKPFIILDDPFYNLDDEKLAQAIELVKKLSNEYQILYFVCHESRRA